MSFSRLIIVAALAALILVPGAAADQSYFDTPGDSVNGSPDVTDIRVTHDAARTISFAARVAGFPAQDTDVYLFVNSDGNPATGENGWDYQFGIDYSDPLTYAWQWNGSAWASFVPSTGRATFQNGIWFVSLNSAELGNTTGFDFYYSASKYSGEQTLGVDEAPNGTAVYTYTLTQTPPPPPPAPPQPPPPPEPRLRTYEDASRLPSRIRYVGQSIKHVRIGENLYATMKRLGSPKVVPVACWSKSDWPSVVESAGFRGNPAQLNGFWLPQQPRWLHLAPKQCRDIQALISTRIPNGQRAYALSTALHERIHADGIRHEAMTECFSIQLVYDFARELGFVHPRALRLEQLAVRKSRAVFAGTKYWNPTHCREGGRWDLYPQFRNLDY